MTGNVLSFRRRTRDERAPSPVSEEARARFVSERLALIKGRMEQTPIIPPGQRLRVANNLWKILAELEEAPKPISKAQVLHAAGKGHEGDSTKRLPYYAIDPELRVKQQKDRAGRLTQKIRKYAEIARRAAVLTQRHEDHFIPALVEGTQYAMLGEPYEAASNEEIVAKAWQEIAGMIVEVAQGIDKARGLKELFEKITSAGIFFTGLFHSEVGKTQTFWSTQNMPRPALVSHGDVVPCPALFLGTIVAGERLPCEFRQHSPWIWNEGDADFEQIRDLIVEEGLDGIATPGYAMPLLNVFLELLPHGKDGTVTPSLRLRPKLNFFLAEAFDPLEQIDIDEEKYDVTRLSADEYVAESWQSVQDSIVCDVSEIECLVSTKTPNSNSEHNFIYFYTSMHFDETVIEAYRSSLHGRIPENGSLIVSLDETALEYLDTRLDVQEPLPFCGCVEHQLHQSKREVERFESIAGDTTLLAALDRSLSDKLGPFRLDKLLDRQVAEFWETANEAVERHRAELKSEDERIGASLRELRERRGRIAAEYKKA